LSYQAITFTWVPSTTLVSGASKIAEYGEPTMSDETSGSSLYWRIPSSSPLAARSQKIAFSRSRRPSSVATLIRASGDSLSPIAPEGRSAA
jgi:hypothetical protein